MLAGLKGFTLIELMIVVAILSVLIAIAIPSFDNYREEARQASAKSDAKTLIVTLIAAKK